jgi:ferritin
MKQNLLSKEVESKLSDLIAEELKAMYTYVAIANWCQDNGFLQAYDFFLAESKDEKEHSEVLQKYVLDMGCTPSLKDIKVPSSDFKTIKDVIYAAYDMEVALGEMYSDFSIELAKKDVLTFAKIQEFLKIQTESIGFFGDICSAAEGLADTKFEQLYLEKILVKN